MAIFKGREPDDEQKSGAPTPEAGAKEEAPEQPSKPMPPFVAPRAGAPGVVPPAAAPMYSTRPPEPAPEGEVDAERPAFGKATKVREGQQGMQEAVQRTVQNALRRAVAAPPGRGARVRQARPSAAVAGSMARPRGGQSFDPERAAQTGLLNLAWSWHEAGSPIRAINAYVQLLCRYPDTPAADAAVADLVEISDSLADTGHFHIALGIYEELEELL